MTSEKPEDFIPILFKSAAEFQSREGYQPRLTCERDQLDRIVGKYSFTKEEQLECGLNGCNTKHWNGWIIRTKSGQETHCGKDCGEREFDVLFREVEATYKAAVERQSKRERLLQISADRDRLLGEATVLAEQVAVADQRLQGILSEIKKDAALDRAFHACVRSDGRILVEDEESKRLRAAMGASAGKADLKTIGVIRGSAAVSSFGNVASELKYRVIAPLQDLTVENLNALSDKDLTTKTQVFSQVQTTLGRARQFLSAFAQFDAPANGQVFPLLQYAIPKKARTGRGSRILEKIRKLYSPDVLVTEK